MAAVMTTVVTTTPGAERWVVPMSRPFAPAAATGRAPVPARRGLPRAVYWWRRALAGVAVVGIVVVTAQAGAALGGLTPATPERRPAAGGDELASVTVRQGDSLWSIAQRLAPGEDPRPLVDALDDARDGAPLVPGETVEWGGGT